MKAFASRLGEQPGSFSGISVQDEKRLKDDGCGDRRGCSDENLYGASRARARGLFTGLEVRQRWSCSAAEG